MNALNSAVLNNRELNTSLTRLSSGLRINSSADDASGMTISDSLRMQANSLGQAIKNANDAIGIIQIADKAMDEQVKILDTIKTKATQAAQDGQNTQSRTAIQNDIMALMAELDMIAATTSYNGMGLLNGSFTGKQFQVGAYSNQTVNVSIGNTASDVIGSVRSETTADIRISGIGAGNSLNATALNANTDLKIYTPMGTAISIASVVLSQSAGTGLGALAAAINKASDQTGITASYQTSFTASGAVQAMNTTANIVINGITIGAITNVVANDADGKVVNAINAASTQTGVTASIDATGRLTLTSNDGRGIMFGGLSGVAMYPTAGNDNLWSSGNSVTTYGRLTLKTLGANDIIVSSSNVALAAMLASGSAALGLGGVNSYTANLKSLATNYTISQGAAIGAFGNDSLEYIASSTGNYLGVGVTTRAGAMLAMDIAESAIKQLDRVRAGLGSAQNQIVATVNNISVTQVNVKSAESQIRDVDFAEESSNFSKRNILAQSGSYALSQANQVQQNVLRLLQ